MRALIDGFVDADDVVMLVLNAKSLGERYDQVLFIHLRVALNGFVLAAFRDVAQLCQCFVS